MLNSESAAPCPNNHRIRQIDSELDGWDNILGKNTHFLLSRPWHADVSNSACMRAHAFVTQAYDITEGHKTKDIMSLGKPNKPNRIKKIRHMGSPHYRYKQGTYNDTGRCIPVVMIPTAS